MEHDQEHDQTFSTERSEDLYNDATTRMKPSNTSGGFYHPGPSRSHTSVEEPAVNFTEGEAMAASSRAHLVRREESQRADEYHRCHLCKKRFKKEANLHIHLSIHSRLKEYRCYQCGKVFVRGKYLTQHYHYCKPYQCGCCMKTFKTEVMLVSHVCPFAGRDHK